MNLICVCIGSAIGGGLRYLVARWVSGYSHLPYGTFIVNVVGCLLIGLIGTMISADGSHSQTRLLLTTGFCGGFTTFSTFVSEGTTLASGGDTIIAAGYIAASLFFGIIAYVGGCALGRMI